MQLFSAKLMEIIDKVEELAATFLQDEIKDTYFRSIYDENTEEELTIIPDIQNFIENAVKFCINIQTPPEKDKNLLKYAENISKNHKVSRYIDAETGLYSINHFYID